MEKKIRGLSDELADIEFHGSHRWAIVTPK